MRGLRVYLLFVVFAICWFQFEKPSGAQSPRVFAVTSYGAAGDGVTDARAAIDLARQAATANGGVIYFPRGTYLCSSSITFDDDTILKFDPGAMLKPATGVTLTVNGGIDTGLNKIFDNAFASQGTISILSYKLRDVYPEWWGASVGGAASTNTPAIQAAIVGAFGSNRTNASGLYVYNRDLVFSGMFDINDTLNAYHVHGAVIRGLHQMGCGLRQAGLNKIMLNVQSMTRTRFVDMRFQADNTMTADRTAMIILDYDGSQGADLRIQNIRFEHCFFIGNGLANIGVWISPTPGSQGDNVSFENCYTQNFLFAGHVIGGNGVSPLTSSGYSLNALHIEYSKGDIQSCKNGLVAYGGNWIVRGTTIENQSRQVLDGAATTVSNGVDVYCEGALRGCVMQDILTESYRIGAGVEEFRNVRQQGTAAYWYSTNGFDLAGTTGNVGTLITGTRVGGDGRLYRITTGGTWGGLGLTTATGGSATTIVKTGAGWGTNAFAGYRASIWSGAGAYQYGVITSNTSDTLTISGGWTTYYSAPNQITITNPDSSSSFVIEPNWGTQFTAGTVTFEFVELNIIDGTLGQGSTIKANGLYLTYPGRIRVSQFIQMNDVTLHRHDWFASNGFPLDDTFVEMKSSQIIVAFDGTAFFRPWSVPRNGPAQFTDVTQQQQGSEWIVFSQGQFGGGVPFLDVAVGRGDGVSYSASNQVSRNVLGTKGTLGRRTAWGTNVAGEDMNIAGGYPTGNAAPGAINFWIGTAGSSGTTVTDPVISAGIGANRLFWSYRGPDVASAASIAPSGNLFHVTGTTTITSILTTGITNGTKITIIFDGALTLTDGSNLRLNGDFVTTADDTITLIKDGSNWYELFRSVN